ncbi:MAG: type II toxin-antitoxin system VapC family toxin [Candidatus Poribacteria bacterium]
MSANKLNFGAKLPEIIYWDTSFVHVCLIGESTEPYYTECQDFQTRLKREGVLSVVSDFVYDETAFIWVKRELVKAGKSLGLHWLDMKDRQPNLIGQAMRDFKGKKADLEELTLKLPIADEVTTLAFDLMEQFDLLPTDAYHIAIALSSEVTAFVTIDEDFLRVDGIDVYTAL